jgi:MerR family transcriptional regulator, light-induced transcriptional regulator
MYTIGQAAARSGINVSLLRAWERRYGIVAPSRTEGGYRLYDDDAIERLRAMRRLVDDGWAPRQAADQLRGADPERVAELAGAGASPELPSDSIATTAAFVTGAARIDGEAIEAALDEMFARGSFERVVEERLYPALHALGDAWESGEVDVAGEHTASAAAVRRLAMAFEAAGGNGGPAPVLVGLPSGARHEIASLAFATAVRRAGIPVVYLGSDVPAASWVAAARRTRARAVALGVVLDDDVATANDVIAAMHGLKPSPVLAVGGRRSDRVGDGSVVRLPDGLDAAVAELQRALI